VRTDPTLFSSRSTLSGTKWSRLPLLVVGFDIAWVESAEIIRVTHDRPVSTDGRFVRTTDWPYQKWCRVTAGMAILAKAGGASP
jgi:hypothetical protein